MHGQAPLSVSAIAQTEKPDVYPKVDDEATVILRYPKAQAVLMPSWNWPFSRNDVELYGATDTQLRSEPTSCACGIAEKRRRRSSKRRPFQEPIEFAGLPGRSPARGNQTGWGSVVAGDQCCGGANFGCSAAICGIRQDDHAGKTAGLRAGLPESGQVESSDDVLAVRGKDLDSGWF